MIPFLYQLQNVTFTKLSNLAFKVAVIDMDESGLTASNIEALQAQGKILYTYLSIGEAEDYRDYWTWTTRNKPSWVLSENPDWEGNFRVKFWDTQWQNICFERARKATALGYDGLYLDIVDAYQVGVVKRQYKGTNIANEMVDFVTKLSDINNVIPQNAVELLVKPTYRSVISGIGVEDLWFDGNKVADWTADDLKDIRLILPEHKFALVTSYPTQTAKQNTFINNALKEKLIPFVTDRDLTGKVPAVNNTTFDKLEGFNTPWM